MKENSSNNKTFAKEEIEKAMKEIDDISVEVDKGLSAKKAEVKVDDGIVKEVTQTKEAVENASLAQDLFRTSRQVRKNDKLCIVGTASTWSKAPFGADGVDFWGLNGLHGFTDPADKTRYFNAWFQIHPKKEITDQKDHYAWLRATDIPVFTQVPFPDIKNNIIFPAKELLKIYPKYFKSSFGWMIALAMELGYKEIQLYGVHVSSDSEYAYQKPNTEFYVGLAMGRGISVQIPAEADIVKEGALYAYEDTDGIRAKFDHEIDILTKRSTKLESDIRRAELTVAKYKGALERDKYWKRTLG